MSPSLSQQKHRMAAIKGVLPSKTIASRAASAFHVTSSQGHTLIISRSIIGPPCAQSIDQRYPVVYRRCSNQSLIPYVFTPSKSVTIQSSWRLVISDVSIVFSLFKNLRLDLCSQGNTDIREQSHHYHRYLVLGQSNMLGKTRTRVSRSKWTLLAVQLHLRRHQSGF